jgi:hypothetical protein
VANEFGSATSDAVWLSVICSPPQITVQPQSRTVTIGSTVSFEVGATGSLPMRYHWYRNWVPLNGDGRAHIGQEGTLTLGPVAAGDAGVYWVTANNEFGSVTSESVWLSVIASPPRITAQPQNVMQPLGCEAVLEVEATGSQPLAYQWQWNGVNLVDQAGMFGSRSSRLEIAALSPSHLGSYRVMVSNAFGRVTSASAVLTTSSPLLFTAVDAGQIVVWWNDAGRGMTLQRASSFSAPQWEDVPDSESTNRAIFPITGGSAFFRLFSHLPLGMIGWWAGDGNTLDLTTNHNDGVPQNVNYMEGTVGQAFAFNGNGSIFVNSTFPFHGTSDATLAFWLLYHSPGGPETAIFWTRPDLTDADRFNIFVGNEANYFMGNEANQLMVDYRSPGGDLHLHFGPVVPLDAWVHVAVTRTGNVYSVYTNGLFAVAMTDSSPDLPTAAGWMMSGWGNPNWLVGGLDEVMLYSRALTDAEIKAIYNTGNARKIKPPL